MSKTYTLYLNSNDLVSGTKTNGTFYVDWKSFLPSSTSEYKLSTYFKTFNDTDVVANETLLIYSSLVSSNNNFNTTTKGKSQLLAIAEPVNQYTFITEEGLESYYSTKNPYVITIDYPPQNNITITIRDETNTIFNSAVLNNYILILTFEEC